MDNQSNEIFKIPARRCSVCGGLLTSDKSIREGCGPACKLKLKQAAQAEEVYEYVRGANTVEIIGNIHDNPESRKEEEGTE